MTHGIEDCGVSGPRSGSAWIEQLCRVTNEETKMDKTNWHRPNEEMHGKQTSCPKCELEFKTMLHPFCQHHECPVRDWQDAQNPPKPADTRPSLVERLRTEADLCRNEAADDVAALLDEAADEIQRYNAGNQR